MQGQDRCSPPSIGKWCAVHIVMHKGTVYRCINYFFFFGFLRYAHLLAFTFSKLWLAWQMIMVANEANLTIVKIIFISISFPFPVVNVFGFMLAVSFWNEQFIFETMSIILPNHFFSCILICDKLVLIKLVLKKKHMEYTCYIINIIISNKLRNIVFYVNDKMS